MVTHSVEVELVQAGVVSIGRVFSEAWSQQVRTCCKSGCFSMQLLNPRLHPTQFLVCLYLSKCSITEAGGIAIAGALAAGKLP